MYCMAIHAGPHKKGPFPSDSWAGWVSEESEESNERYTSAASTEG